MNKNIKEICLNAIFVALYFCMCLFIPNISFGSNGIVSLRIAEILVALVIFDKKFIYGIIISCFLTNLFLSDFGIIDAIVGTIQSFITSLILILVKNKHFAILLGSLVCGIIIGLEIYFLVSSPFGLLSIITTFISEFLILEIGYLLLKKTSIITMIK